MTLELDTKDWKERHGLEPEDAATALGISRAQVYRHLAGRPLPRRTALLMEMYDRDPLAMCEVAGVKLEGGQLKLVKGENADDTGSSADDLYVSQG